MAKPRNKIVDYLLYVVVRTLTMFVHMYSWESNYRMARRMGDVMYRVIGRYRKRALAHLKLSFPEWSDEKCEQVARASMRNFVYLGLEVLFTTRLITPGSWRRHITLENLGENIRMLLERKTGLIYVTGPLRQLGGRRLHHGGAGFPELGRGPPAR